MISSQLVHSIHSHAHNFVLRDTLALNQVDRLSRRETSRSTQSGRVQCGSALSSEDVPFDDWSLVKVILLLHLLPDHGRAQVNAL